MLFTVIKSLFSIEGYYIAGHKIVQQLLGKDIMLHFPLFEKENQTIEDGNKYMTDYCLKKFSSDFKNRKVLEIGCGNGVQSIYIAEKYQPEQITGIDILPNNIEYARNNLAVTQLRNVVFSRGDAQTLQNIEDKSLDYIICIESAFHYPDKIAFLKAAKRVLKDEGMFLIVDITNRKKSKPNIYYKMVHANHWTREEYIDAFRKTGFNLVSEEDITEKVLKAFDKTTWVLPTPVKKGLNWYISKIYFKYGVHQYFKQLRTIHYYNIFLLNKNPEVTD